MPVFFITAGYNFIHEKRTIKENITIKFKSVLIPFWYVMLIYTAIEIFRAPYIGYGDFTIVITTFINTVYGSGHIPNIFGLFTEINNYRPYGDQSVISINLISPMNCPLWFLPAFFTSCVIFYTVITKIKNNPYAAILCIITLNILASLEVILPQMKQLPYGLGRGFMGASFMIVGLYMSKYTIFENNKNFVIISFICCLLFAIFSIFMGSNGAFYINSDYGQRGIVSVFLTFAGGTAAAYCILCLSKAIESFNYNKVKSLLSLIGRNTMPIYLWHMALGVILDVLYIEIFNVKPSPDEFYMALFSSNEWQYIAIKAITIVTICIYMVPLKNKIKNAYQQKTVSALLL